MQKTRVVQFRSKNITQLLSEGYAFIIMYIAYLSGIMLGALLLNSGDPFEAKAVSIFEEFNRTRTDGAFISMFFSAFLDWLPYMLAVFVCGTCIVGMVLIPIFVCYKGFSYGLLAGYLYSIYSFKGIIFVLILIIPSALIGAFGLFFAAKHSFKFSLLLAKSSMPNARAEYIYPQLIRYCKFFIYLLLVSISAALVDALCSVAFFGTVNLV